MSRANIILRNVASNWVGFAVNAAVTLVLTPFVVRHLGTAGYGIWILSASVIGYYGFLDLGFRAGVTQYLTRYLAAGELERASECISSAVAALCALGAIMVLLSVGAAFAVPRLFDMPDALADEAFWCVLIVGASSGLQFALSPFTSVFAATQRFDLANLIGVVTRLLTALGIVLALEWGYGLIGISLATCAVSLIDYAIRYAVARRLAPGLQLSTSKASLARLREISIFGAWNFLINLNAFVCQHVPNMLIGAFLPVAAIGHYALSIGLVRHIIATLSPIGQVIYPAAAALDVTGDRRGLERLYHDGSRLMVLVMIPVTLLTFLWAEDFYRLWVGSEFVEGVEYPSVALVFQILLVGTAANFSNIGAHILMGSGRVRIVALTLMCGSGLNLTLSIALVGTFGLIGVALASIVASVLVDLVAIPILVQRQLGLAVIGLLRRAWARPLAVGVLQLAAASSVRLFGTPADWFELIAQGMLAALLCASIAVALGITAVERERFLLGPLRRISGRRQLSAG